MEATSVHRWMDEDVVCTHVHMHARARAHTHTHTHTVEYYSAIKKNEILSFATTWMDLEIITLSEISQKEREKFLYNITYMWHLKKII